MPSRSRPVALACCHYCRTFSRPLRTAAWIPVRYSANASTTTKRPKRSPKSPARRSSRDRTAVSRSHRAVAPVAELVHERRPRRVPTELGAGLYRVGALVQQEGFREVVTGGVASLVVGAATAPGAPTATTAASVRCATVGFTQSLMTNVASGFRTEI